MAGVVLKVIIQKCLYLLFVLHGMIMVVMFMVMMLVIMVMFMLAHCLFPLLNRIDQIQRSLLDIRINLECILSGILI